jgi:hypothetical protein
MLHYVRPLLKRVWGIDPVSTGLPFEQPYRASL